MKGYISIHQAKDIENHTGPWTYNWIVRRQPCFMLSGDSPRFALVETPRIPEVNTHFYVLSQIRIKVYDGGKSFWLDEQGKSQTKFYPWGTEHQITTESGKKINVEALLIENNSVGVRILSKDTGLKFDIYCGSAVKKFINFFPEYITSDFSESGDDSVRAAGEVAVIGDSEFDIKVKAVAAVLTGDKYISVEPKVTDSNLVCFANVSADAVVIISKDDIKAQDYELQADKAKKYYEELLGRYDINTPDEVVDTGFNAAIVNMDYTYQAPAWFEGIHEWNSYFCNNYQISAAIGLGEYELAKKALLFIGEREAGPGYVLRADGSEMDLNFPDGVLYYVLQLYQYWKATGDQDTVNRVSGYYGKAMDRFINETDIDGNMIAGFHYGCNAFMYQADHLSLPGDAVSPTAMLAGVLDMGAELADSMGDNVRAQSWRLRAKYMKKELLNRFWSDQKSKFTGLFDAQGLEMAGNYYTDYVFPVIYADVPVEYAIRSMFALKRDLWVGDHLMRIGNFKPQLFGNSAVQPVQMAEASEAYFKCGLNDDGWALLYGTALSSTTATDSPGSYPEFCTFTGRGLPDYTFSNPAAAYIRAVIEGLFGIKKTAAAKKFVWSPQIPNSWDKASIKLRDVSVSISGKVQERTYHLELAAEQAVEFKASLSDIDVTKISYKGGDMAFEKAENKIGQMITFQLPPAKDFTFTVSGKNVNKPKPVLSDYPKREKFKFELIAGDRRTVPLPEFNSDSISGRNFWKLMPHPFDLTSITDADGFVKTKTSKFKVKPTGLNMYQLERAITLPFGGQVVAISHPDTLTVNVGRKVKGVEFLVSTEAQIRLTDMKVGSLTLVYEDGYSQETELVYGDNVDSFIRPHIDEFDKIKLEDFKYLYVLPIRADSGRALKFVKFDLSAADTSIGVFSANTIE